MQKKQRHNVILFKDAVPYEGVLSRATSANGVWVLPHDFTRYEDIEDARTKNYLLFKANDGAKHALSLTATLGNTTIKTAYDLGASLKKIGKVEVYPNNLTNCAVNKEYVPTYSTSSVDANAVYDYWLTFEQSADNLKAVQLYGAEIVNDGHSFRYTRDTGVNNSVKLVYNYILMDGTVVEGDKVGNYMYAPLFEAFTTAYEKEYSKFIPNAEYYVLKGNPKYNIYDGKIMDYTYDKLNAPLTEIAYSSKAEEWETYIHKGDVNSSEIEIFAEYNFYGVYPATEEQVKDFTLVFASLLGDAKEVKTKASEYISNNVTREVILKDTDFTLTDALGNPFYLFDGITADGNIDPRDEMNQRQGFEEDTEGFARNFVLANANITAVDKNGKTIFDKAKGSIIVGTTGTAVVDPDGSITITQGYAGFYENLYR